MGATWAATAPDWESGGVISNQARQSSLYLRPADRIAAERSSFAATIKSLCAHPGPTDSGLQAKTANAGGTRLLDQYILWRTLKSAQSVEDGALGITRACCAADVKSLDFYGPVGSGQGGAAELLPQARCRWRAIVMDRKLKSNAAKELLAQVNSDVISSGGNNATTTPINAGCDL